MNLRVEEIDVYKNSCYAIKSELSEFQMKSSFAKGEL